MNTMKIPRRRRAKVTPTAPVEVVPAPLLDDKVRVQCVVDIRPWYSGSFLTLDEVAEIPAADAEIMIALGQVKLVA